MTFLCLKGGHDTKTGPSNKNVKTQTHSVEAVIEDESPITEDTVEYEGLNEEASINFTLTRAKDIMLETFSATLTGGDSKMARARIFKDNGSQRNFITTKLATQLQCPVIQQDVLLNIRGFVANKTVKSNLVKVFIKINDMIYDVPAICVDVINTSFKAHDVNNIASVFGEHGYTIPDDALHTGDDTVSNIDMVLGSESRHILPCKDVLFGAENPSVFVDTPIGVMLSGSTSCMRNNLTSLPVRNSVTQACTVIVASGICESISDTNTNFASIDHSGECVFSCDDSDVTRHAEVYNDTLDDNKFSESESLIATSVLQTMKHGPDGRCIVSLPWNHKLSHLLSKNFNLARQVLKSTYRKLKNDPELLHLYDDVIKEQENSNIIEKIDNIEQHLQKDPNCAFLAHMGIFKSSSETTKCRVVYLSNICEKSKSNNISVSHNMALLPGPSLNNKISTAIIFLRFDKFLLIFDLCKAFLQIGLNIEDSNRLMFLWFKNVRMEDFSVVAYRCLRLPFGLRPSPFLLTMVLYKMLIVDGHSDEKVHKLKAEIYNNIYVDNGGVTANTVDELKWKYETLEQIFNEYKFELQQYATNDAELQNCVDNETSSTTTKEVKMLGHVWNRETDSLSPSKIKLDDGANTLRKCLSSVNSVYDLFGIYCPVLLRVRLFVQSLQNDQTLNWDTELSHSRQKEWQKICKQANNTPIMTIPRFVGSRSGTYSLIIFTDASQSVCGGVVYLLNIDENIISFCGAYSKLLCENLKKKSIPCLELLGIVWGLQYVFDKYEALTSNDVIQPICISSIVLYTDSTCCLHWLESYSYKFDKMNDKSTFVKNKLRQIDDLCSRKAVKFIHTRGVQNLADVTTKPCSYGVLKKNDFKFLRGPDIIEAKADEVYITDRVITIPNPGVLPVDEVFGSWACNTDPIPVGDLTTKNTGETKLLWEVVLPIDLSKCSNFFRLVRTLKYVLMFLNNLKNRTAGKGLLCLRTDMSLHRQAKMMIIRSEQKRYFQEELKFLSVKGPSKLMPTMIAKLNLFVDDESLLRVRCKMGKFGNNFTPIILPRNSITTKAIITQTHKIYSHCGAHQLVNALNKQFYINSIFSLVKVILRECTTCRRFNARPIKLNQSDYRLERVNPENQPFANIYLDYAGPFTVNLCGSRTKVYLLILTCMWTRAVNIIICRSADATDFLKALQEHIYSYGVFKSCISDLGSQIRAGASTIQAYLSDPDTQDFLDFHNMKWMQFKQFAKGHSALGSLVEVCVKQVKLLIQKTLKRVILDYFHFEHLVAKCNCLINKRPVAFKSELTTLSPHEVPEPVTPEMLIKGYETKMLDIVPAQEASPQDIDDDSDNFIPYPASMNDQYTKLKAAKSRLVSYYNHEFLNNLISQAIDKKDRYKPVNHERLNVGDIVLLVEPNTKRLMYPMAKIERVERNELGETTAVYVFKGATRESVYRHATSVILLLSNTNSDDNKIQTAAKKTPETKPQHTQRPIRQAALKCKEKMKDILN